jgi:hypothetical protein
MFGRIHWQTGGSPYSHLCLHHSHLSLGHVFVVLLLLRPRVPGAGRETRAAAADVVVGGAQRRGAAATAQRRRADRFGRRRRLPHGTRHRVQLDGRRRRRSRGNCRLLNGRELVRVHVALAVTVEQVAAAVVVRVPEIRIGWRTN